MMQLGNLKIHFINDADVRIDPGGAFGLVPRALWQRVMTPDQDHLVPMIQMCLYVEAPGRKIVIDTGLGYRPGQKLERAVGLGDIAFARHPDSRAGLESLIQPRPRLQSNPILVA